MSSSEKPSTPKRLSGIERAMKDIEEGRVYKALDVDDLMNQLHS